MTTDQTLDLLQRFGGDLGACYAHLRGRIAAKRRTASAARASAYGRWRQMMRRCYEPAHVAFHNYGGRGISVCERWHDFDAYYADVGSPPRRGLSMDRENNDGNYEPGNVRWATAQQRVENRRPRRG